MKRAALLIRQSIGARHQHQIMPMNALVVCRMHMRIRVRREAAALVEALAADGDFVHRRVNFQNHRAVIGKHRQRARTVPLAAQGGENAEMLDVAEIRRFPVEHIADEGAAVPNRREVIVRVGQNGGLRGRFTLLMRGKADPVERHRVGVQRVTGGCNPFKCHVEAPSGKISAGRRKSVREILSHENNGISASSVVGRISG